jgi:predicted ATPase/DNA-binding CsgD family transcriptional regulator
MSGASPSVGISPPLPPFGRDRSAVSGVRVPITSLNGREPELAELQALLDGDDIRLLTLTGPGGIGKTRLALEVAARVQGDFAHGACFVPLDGIRDSRLVPNAIAEALGVRESADQSIADVLAVVLRPQHLLLVLDNLEQVVDAGVWLASLLAECPRLKMLVTSRALLHIQGERQFLVPPLPLPAEGGDLRESVEAIAESPSVALFVERARAVKHDFALDATNAGVVRDICERLDGLPLAIELAAVRVNVLSPAAILARLTDRLRLLTGSMRDVPLRLQTMRNAIAWSHELLEPDEQAIFRRLAVFVNGFTLDAAEAVAMPAPDDATVRHRDMRDLSESTLVHIASLLDQSLIQQVLTDRGESRFRMLGTIREYGLEQLAERGETDEASRRHAEWFLAFAERAEPYLTGPEQVSWLNRIEEAHDDLRAAFDWLHGHGEHERSLRLATALWRFGYTRGHFSETRGWLESSLASFPEPTMMRAAALNAVGILANLQGDFETAATCHTKALALCRVHADQHELAMTLNGLANVAENEGDLILASERYESARDVFREIGNQRGVAVMLTNLGNVQRKREERDEIAEYHEQARRLFQEVGDPRGIAWSDTNLGTLALERGDLSTAMAHLADALQRYRELGDQSGIIETLERFADIAERRGQPQRQGTLMAVAAAIRRSINYPVSPGDRDRYEQVLSSLRETLGDTFAPVWGSGQHMMLDEAIGVALSTVSLTSGPVLPEPRPLPQQSTHGLSPRELEVLKLMADGLTNREIGNALFVSHRTVTSHASNILGKLEVASRSAAVAFAIRNNLVN